MFSRFDAIRTNFTFKSVLVEDDVHGAVRRAGGNDVVVGRGRSHATYFAIQFGLFVRVYLPTQSLFQGIRDIDAGNGLKIMKICRYIPVFPSTYVRKMNLCTFYLPIRIYAKTGFVFLNSHAQFQSITGGKASSTMVMRVEVTIKESRKLVK